MVTSEGNSLTDAQNELYSWIKNYMRDFQHSPSIRQMMQAMGLRSPAPIQSRLRHLQEKGWILRNTIIWSKTNPKPSSSKSNLCPTYEFIFHFVASMSYYYNHTFAPIKDKAKASLPPRHRNVNGKSSSSVSPYIPRSGKNMGVKNSQTKNIS